MNSADIAAKYQKTYFMPPEVTYDWVKKDSITKSPIWCSVDLRDGNISILPAKGCKYGTVTKTSVTEVRTEMRQPEKFFSR